MCMNHRLAGAVCGLLAVLVAAPARAQLASVQGRVIDREDDPLAGVNVVLHGPEGRTGRATDDAGRFTFSRLTPGRYVLKASFVGFRTRRDTLELAFGSRRTLEIVLREKETEMEGVTVEEERTGGASTVPGLETVRPSQLESVPTPGLSADLASYLQALPGVIASDQGGQLFVRGGTPTQNLVLVDGIPVYQPFHLIGFYSAFPAGIVSHADVYVGGFGAEYGGRISSVMDVTTTNGDKEQASGAVSLAPFLSSLHVEVPVAPEKVSLTASVRESVVGRIAPTVYGRDLPYRFGDRFGKLHAFLNETSGLSITALNTYDEGNLQNSAGSGNRIRWSNTAVGGHFYHIPPRRAVMLEVSTYYTRFKNRYDPARAPERNAQVEGFGGEMSFTYFWHSAELHFGMFGRTNLFGNDLGRRGGAYSGNVNEGGLFGDVQWDVTNALRLAPGLRLHTFPGRSRVTLEPRLRLRLALGAGHEVRLAWGRYHQQIIGLSNLNDVTDAFVAWRPSPKNEPAPTSTHYIGGWEANLAKWLHVSVEGYYKQLRHLTNAQFEEGGTLVSIERVDGHAEGLDLRVTVRRGPLLTQVGYGLAAVTYQDAAGTTYHPRHDRRHKVSTLLRWKAGPYSASARWQYGSGRPFTQAAGFYDEPARPTPDGDRAHHTASGELSVLRGAPFQGRLPAYHRLDVSVKRTFTYRCVRATLQGSLINTYDRPNLFDYNLLTKQRVNQLPFLPSVGLKVELK
jgi:hypothetical protein